jgi:DNA repair exonuclease SbcCD nuclease subunit
MTTFIHTADWQLGKPFARVEDLSKRVRLQQERISVLHRIADAVTDRNADFVLVAGDLFDSTTVTRTIVSEACSAIGRMSVPVYVIPGNHDHGGPGGIWEQAFFRQESEQLAPNLTILLSPEVVQTEHAVLFPCPLLRRHDSTDTTAWLRQIDADDLEQFGNKPRIVLAHGSTQGFGSVEEDEDSGGDSTNQIDLTRLPSGVFDYVALGDWHGTKEVAANAWYSGTPELDRFPKGDSNRPGNILVVQSTRGASPAVTEIATAKFRWHERAFRFSEDSALELFQQNIAEVIGNRVGEDLMRLDLTGSLGLVGQASLETILESLRSRLLRVKLSINVRIAPTSAEIESLTMRSDDPVIAEVARTLLSLAEGESENAQVARIALRELHAACHSV